MYALGVSLYELLSGTHPFTAGSFSELCVKVSLDAPEPLRKHRPDVPEALAEVIAVAYARSPLERYQTTGRFAAALAPFAQAGTVRRIQAIEAFERGSYPDGKIPERRPTPLGLVATTATRPPRIGWEIYALVAGAGLVLAGVLWVALAPGSSPGAGAGGAPSAPATRADAAPAGSAVIP